MATSPPPPQSRATTSEERVDVRRYLHAIGRSRTPIVLVVLLVTGVVVALSLVLPKTYTAETQIVLNDRDSGLSQPDAESITRELTTTQTLLTAPNVLDTALPRLPGETRTTLEDKVDSSVDPEANIISISAKDDSAGGAAAIANQVSRTFLAERTRIEREGIAQTREQIESEIAQLEAGGSETADLQVAALRERVSQLSVSEGSAGSDLSQVSAAEPPDEPSSPRPLRNGILAFFGALFVAVLVALGRDQLAPRVSSPRDLGRLLELRVLAGVPYVRGLRRRHARMMSGVEAEAYETVRSVLETSAPAEGRAQVVLVTGAVHGEGKTTASWRIANSLARAGHRVLVVTADLRVPRMHETANISNVPGLSDVLAQIDWEGARPDPEILRKSVREVYTAGPGRKKEGALHIIPSGTKAKDPGRLISGPGTRAFFEFLHNTNYAYVIVDAPPLLGLADSQVLSRYADQLILVHRLDRLTEDHVADERQVLDGLDLAPLGVIVIGARSEVSPYYAQRRPSIVQTGM